MGFDVVNDPYCVVQDWVEFRGHFLACQHLALKHAVSCLAFRRHFFQLGGKSRQPARHRGSPVSTDPNTKLPVQSACSVFLQHSELVVELGSERQQSKSSCASSWCTYWTYTNIIALFSTSVDSSTCPPQRCFYSVQQLSLNINIIDSPGNSIVGKWNLSHHVSWFPPQKFETDVFCSGQY